MICCGEIIRGAHFISIRGSVDSANIDLVTGEVSLGFIKDHIYEIFKNWRGLSEILNYSDNAKREYAGYLFEFKRLYEKRQEAS